MGLDLGPRSSREWGWVRKDSMLRAVLAEGSLAKPRFSGQASSSFSLVARARQFSSMCLRGGSSSVFVLLFCKILL